MPPVPKLIVLSEQMRGQQFELTEDSYTIGRSEKQKICIPDATISTLHCELVKGADGSYTVKDVGSTNGTRINGVRITDQKLMNTDILQIGGVELMYDCEDDTITSQVKTKTQIDINEKVEPKKASTNLGPEWDAAKKGNPKWNIAFKLIIGLLALVVLVLMGILVWMFKGKGG